jgi:hypothetical protein
VDSGVPTSVMYNQIDKDTQNQQLIAKGNLIPHVMDPNDWEKKTLATNDNYDYYIQNIMLKWDTLQVIRKNMLR